MSIASVASGIARMAGRQAIPSLFAQGLSASAGLNFLKSLNQGYRRKTFLADWREITGGKKLERAYKYIPKKYALSYSLMTPTETKQRREFRYVFETKHTSPITGESIFDTVSMGSDTRHAPADVEALMTDVIDDKEVYSLILSDYEIESVELKVVYRKVQ